MSTKSEVDILYALIEARYGIRFTPDELEEIRRGLDAILDSAKAMHPVKLENGDEPYQFFKPNGDEE